MNPRRTVIVIGGSAGSMEPLIHLISNLEYNQMVDVALIVHRSNELGNMLGQLLNNYTVYKVMDAEHMEILSNGIYLAPTDYHLLVDENYRLHFDFSEKVHHSRPSIDVTLESFSYVFRENLIAVILSGSNEDGANGMSLVEQRGGKVFIQDEQSAKYSRMPLAALEMTVNTEGKDIKELTEEINLILKGNNYEAFKIKNTIGG